MLSLYELFTLYRNPLANQAFPPVEQRELIARKSETEKLYPTACSIDSLVETVRTPKPEQKQSESLSLHPHLLAWMM